MKIEIASQIALPQISLMKPLATNILSVLLQAPDHLTDQDDSYREGKPLKATAVEVLLM